MIAPIDRFCNIHNQPAREDRKLPVKMRLDRLLVERGLAVSRSSAQDLIRRGKVKVAGRPVLKTGFAAAPDQVLEIDEKERYAARSAWKLISALDAFQFAPHGRVCLDIGASTGGFTQVLLERGAARVFAVDVGRGQLHASLKRDERVVPMEATDARKIPAGALGQPVEAITCDVSFISILKVLPAILPYAGQNAWLVALIKPQFEVGRPFIGKGGIVKDEAAKDEAVQRVSGFIAAAGWRISGTIRSPISGQDGNEEILIGATRAEG